MRNLSKLPETYEKIYWGQLNELSLLSAINKNICDDIEKFNGVIEFKILNGCLRNKEIDKVNKREFNDYLMNNLSDIDEELTPNFTGILECHLRDGNINTIRTRKNN